MAPLVNLTSDLAIGDFRSNTDAAKSLRYGDGTAYDRPNQGFSQEPFIKGGLDLGGTSTLNKITGGFIRGGALMYAERSIQDSLRVTKFFITSRGITFLSKQVGLQRSNPKISEPNLVGGSPANQRTYNFGVNTLAQVITQGTGAHIKREGATPLSKTGYKDEEGFLADYRQGRNTNRLLYLYDDFIATDPAEAVDNVTPKLKERSKVGQFFAKVGNKIKDSKLGNFISKLFKNPNEELYSYSGGPGSMRS